MTPKQERFVAEYLIDLNATAAYKRAGFTAKGNAAEVNAARLLRNAQVAAAIAKAQEKRSERTEITQDMVLRELAKIGFSDIRKAIKWNSNVAVAAPTMDPDAFDVDEMMQSGIPDIKPMITNQVELVDSDQIDDDTAAAIAEISQTDKGGLKVKLHDKRAALVDIGRHLGLFKDRVELTGKDGDPIKAHILTAEQFEAAAKRIASEI